MGVPEAHQETVDEICAFLGIEPALIERSYRKIAPPLPRDGVVNYEAVARRLEGTPYEQYLD